MMTANEFVHKWKTANLDNWNERATFQTYFNDLCEMVGHDPPVVADPNGEDFKYEKFVIKSTGGRGYADVVYKGKFAWEQKGKGGNLDEAYQQLLRYARALGNPPLLVVGDFETIVIHTNFNNTEYTTYEISLEDLEEMCHLLEYLFHDVSKLRPPSVGSSIADRPRLDIGFEQVQPVRMHSDFGSYSQFGPSTSSISGETEYRVFLTNSSYRTAKLITIDLGIEVASLTRPELQRQLDLPRWQIVGSDEQYFQFPRQYRFEGAQDTYCLSTGGETTVGHLSFWVHMGRNSPELVELIRQTEEQINTLDQEMESEVEALRFGSLFDPRTKQGKALSLNSKLQALQGQGAGSPLIDFGSIQHELLRLYHRAPAKDIYSLTYEVRAEGFSAHRGAAEIEIIWRSESGRKVVR